MTFTSSFFGQLSLKDALDLQIPNILPSGKVILVGWSLKIPTEFCGLFEAASSIPCFEDLQPLLAAQPKQFIIGMRSVHISVDGRCFCYLQTTLWIDNGLTFRYQLQHPFP
jgi:hypothetical protein